MDYKTTIWNLLLADIKNEFGVAGLMGNLEAESGLIPYRVQGDFSNGYTDSIEYTAKVDSGQISEYDFVNNGPGGGGYGLAQWTFYTRKQELYNRYKSGYPSIGNVNLACDFLLYELKTSYTSVYWTLVNAITIKEASDKVLHEFEKPADQSESVEVKRTQMGIAIYEELTGTSGGGGGGTSTTTKRNKKFNFILFNKQRRTTWIRKHS